MHLEVHLKSSWLSSIAALLESTTQWYDALENTCGSTACFADMTCGNAEVVHAASGVFTHFSQSLHESMKECMQNKFFIPQFFY